MCTKFEGNRSTRRVLLCGLNMYLFWCKEEEKYLRKSDDFQEQIILRMASTISFKFVMGGCVLLCRTESLHNNTQRGALVSFLALSSRLFLGRSSHYGALVSFLAAQHTTVYLDHGFATISFNPTAAL